jgi:hypothetical protein
MGAKAIVAEVQTFTCAERGQYDDITVIVAQCSDSPQSIQIQNIGNATLALNGLSVSKSFTLVPDSGTPADCTASSSLAPGGRCNISISFTPEADGLQAGTVTLTDNALNDNPSTQTISLLGDGPQTQVSTTSM